MTTVVNVRNSWKIQDKVYIYSNTKQRWYIGIITKIHHDSEGEWLNVKYKHWMKPVQRNSYQIYPLVKYQFK